MKMEWNKPQASAQLFVKPYQDVHMFHEINTWAPTAFTLQNQYLWISWNRNLFSKTLYGEKYSIVVSLFFTARFCSLCFTFLPTVHKDIKV